MNDLKDQLATLEKNIEERKAAERAIQDQIKEEEAEGVRIVKEKNVELANIRRDTEITKQEMQMKFADLEDDLDRVRLIKHSTQKELQEVQQSNNMMYFFPTKVKEQ